MKKIIHISDLHIGFKNMGERYHQIINKLISKKGKEAHDYVILISGDLIDNAHQQEDYGEVTAGLERLRQTGFENILIIPGNHDYGTGSKGDKKFVKTFQKIFFNDDQTYPRKDIIEDIAFIGLDSIAEELHWYDALWSEGELGNSQLSRLSIILQGDDVRACKRRVIYLHHHPFDARPLHQLKDSKNLKKILTEAMDQNITIDAILYGHNHEGKSHNGEWGIPRCYDAGSATAKPRPKMVKNMAWFQVNSSIRVIDIEKEDVGCDYVLPLLELEEVSD